MKEIVLNIEGLMCSGCEKRVENALGNLKEVKKVNASHKDGKVKIILKDEIDENLLREKIEDIGFKVK